MHEFSMLLYNTVLASVFMSLATMGIGVVLGALLAYTQRNAYD
jgi:hypothetical protein